MPKIWKHPFFFNPFTSRLLVIFVFVHLTFSLALYNIYAFAPDETLYISIFSHLYQPGFSSLNFLGYTGIPALYLRIAYLPAKLLTLLGLSESISLRILAILTSTLAVYLLLCVAKLRPSAGKRLSKLSIVPLFIPSAFLWMSLGLRESFIFLALSLICTGIFLLSRHEALLAPFFMATGSIILINTKAYLAVLEYFGLILLLLAYLIKGRWRSRYTGILLLAIVLPLLVNPPVSKSLMTGTWNYFAHAIGLQTSGSAIISISGDSPAIPVEVIGGGSTLIGLTQELNDHPKSVISTILHGTGIAQSMKDDGANPNGGHPERANVSPAHLRDFPSVMKRSAGFLFTPFPFIDNGTLFLNLLGWEAPLWWLLFALFAHTLWRRIRKKEFDELALFVLAFSIFFIIFSSLVEVNVGTMVRHRTVLLLPMLFLIMAPHKKSAHP